MGLGEVVAFGAAFFLILVLCAVVDSWLERREFKRWLKEGRWKFEKFGH